MISQQSQMGYQEQSRFESQKLIKIINDRLSKIYSSICPGWKNKNASEGCIYESIMIIKKSIFFGKIIQISNQIRYQQLIKDYQSIKYEPQNKDRKIIINILQEQLQTVILQKQPADLFATHAKDNIHDRQKKIQAIKKNLVFAQAKLQYFQKSAKYVEIQLNQFFSSDVNYFKLDLCRDSSKDLDLYIQKLKTLAQIQKISIRLNELQKFQSVSITANQLFQIINQNPSLKKVSIEGILIIDFNSFVENFSMIRDPFSSKDDQIDQQFQWLEYMNIINQELIIDVDLEYKIYIYNEPKEQGDFIKIMKNLSLFMSYFHLYRIRLVFIIKPFIRFKDSRTLQFFLRQMHKWKKAHKISVKITQAPYSQGQIRDYFEETTLQSQQQLYSRDFIFYQLLILLRNKNISQVHLNNINYKIRKGKQKIIEALNSLFRSNPIISFTVEQSVVAFLLRSLVKIIALQYFSLCLSDDINDQQKFIEDLQYMITYFFRPKKLKLSLKINSFNISKLGGISYLHLKLNFHGNNGLQIDIISQSMESLIINNLGGQFFKISTIFRAMAYADLLSELKMIKIILDKDILSWIRTFSNLKYLRFQNCILEHQQQAHKLMQQFLIQLNIKKYDIEVYTNNGNIYLHR